MGVAIDAAGAQALRHDIYGKNKVTRDDLARLIDIGRAEGADAAPEYADLLAEVATDLLAEQVDPPRYISHCDADWLIGLLQGGDGLGNRAEFEMLVGLIRVAVSIPPNLAGFAVAEMEKTIIHGHGGEHAAGVVTHDDVEALRLAVFAATEDSSLHVTRDSAEALFRIAHATEGAANDPGFADFFAKAVGNYLMGIAFHWTPKASEEIQAEKWLDEKPTLGGFLHSMFGGHDDEQTSANHMESELEQAIDAREHATEGRRHLTDLASSVSRRDDARAYVENQADAREMAEANRIDDAEADWLLAHLTRDGRLSSPETSLLRFLKAESPSISPKLQDILDRQAA